MKKNEVRSKVKKGYRDLVEHIRKDKSTFIIYSILRILVILVMIAQFFNKNYENVYLCILTLLLLILPSIIEMNFKIELPNSMEIIIMVFIFAAEILGEIHEYYIIFPFWDTMLHTINGFLAAAIGFSLVNLLNHSERITFKLSPFFVALMAFCFSMTIGVVWEFFEFGMDMIFRFDMQKDTVITSISTVLLDTTRSNTPVIINDIYDVTVNGVDLGVNGYIDIGLIDTMMDLIVNFIGAITFSVIGYFYLKRGGGNRRFEKHFMVKGKREKQINKTSPV